MELVLSKLPTLTCPSPRQYPIPVPCYISGLVIQSVARTAISA